MLSSWGRPGAFLIFKGTSGLFQEGVEAGTQSEIERTRNRKGH